MTLALKIGNEKIIRLLVKHNAKINDNDMTKVFDEGRWQLCQELLKSPLHPYTKVLLDAIPQVDRIGVHNRIVLKGDIPSPLNPPTGCKFHTRCPDAMDKCSKEAPESKEHSPKHWASCHLL